MRSWIENHLIHRKWRRAKRIVSDEDKAIIGAVKMVFPEVAHSFCVFHQLKTLVRGIMRNSVLLKRFQIMIRLPTMRYLNWYFLIRLSVLLRIFKRYENLTLILNFLKHLIKRFLMPKRFSARMWASWKKVLRQRQIIQWNRYFLWYVMSWTKHGRSKPVMG